MKKWKELKTSELNSLTVGTEVRVNDIETAITELQTCDWKGDVIGFDTKDPIVETNPDTFWGIHTHRETIYVLSEGGGGLGEEVLDKPNLQLLH